MIQKFPCILRQIPILCLSVGNLGYLPCKHLFFCAQSDLVWFIEYSSVNFVKTKKKKKKKKKTLDENVRTKAKLCADVPKTNSLPISQAEHGTGQATNSKMADKQQSRK